LTYFESFAFYLKIEAMSEFLNEIIEQLKTPKHANFWPAWTFVAVVIGGIFAAIKWFGKSRVARIERVLTSALVEDYENWVAQLSESKCIDIGTLDEWLSEGRVALLGHDYSVFKNFMNRLNKNDKKINIPDEIWFLAISEKFKSSPKWGRVGW
jgi:hypothetical protein